MNLLEDERVTRIVESLRASHQSLEASRGYDDQFARIRASVSHWKYASDEFYSVIPLHHELNKFKKGRQLKLGSIEEAIERAAYAFGFTDERLLLTLHPYAAGGKTGVECMAMTYRDTSGSEIDYTTSIQYLDNSLPSRLVSVGSVHSLEPALRVDARVGAEGAFAISAYHYAENQIHSVDRYAKGWNGQTRYDVIYINDEPQEILIAGHRWWKAKR